jgi:hypothetical protein
VSRRIEVVMSPTQEVDHILHDCFFALGQAIGLERQTDFEAIVWWRTRYRESFLRALIDHGNSWPDDRPRLTAVGRYLGQRARHHAGDQPTIDVRCAQRASADVEAGCHMRARESAALSARSDTVRGE